MRPGVGDTSLRWGWGPGAWSSGFLCPSFLWAGRAGQGDGDARSARSAAVANVTAKWPRITVLKDTDGRREEQHFVSLLFFPPRVCVCTWGRRERHLSMAGARWHSALSAVPACCPSLNGRPVDG